ncbi:MAG: sigma factor, partial [Clostridia bacterium]
MMKNDSLSSLAIMAKGGDEDAICSIVGEFKVTVRQIARKYFLLGAEMEDLIQEGMIGLIKAINSFSEDK